MLGVSTVALSLVLNAAPFIKDKDGLSIPVNAGTLRLQVFSPEIVRVQFWKGSKPTDSSLAVIGKPSKTKWTTQQKGNQISLKTSALEARVNKKTGTVAFFDLQGKPILAERTPGTLTPNTIGTYKTYKSRQEFTLAPGEGIYGLGQHQEAGMNYVGRTIHLQQENREVAVPVLLSSKGYGILWDNPAVTDVNVASDGEAIIPAANFYDEDGQPGGLTARYYEGKNFEKLVSTRKDAQIDFNWTQTPPPGLEHDRYSVRWTGSFEVKNGGDYVLTASGDDGIRLWIDGKKVLEDWNDRAIVSIPVKLNFKPNSRHKIRFEFNQNIGDSVVKLAWQVPSKDHKVVWNSEAANAIDYYFMYGPKLPAVVSNYRKLTGQAPMFGKWAWGMWQSRERYTSQKELLDIVAGYRSRKIPFDGIIQDWQYWSPAPWGSHEFDPKRYPNPAQLMKDLHADNVHMLISVWPKFDVPADGKNPNRNVTELESVGGMYAKTIPYVFPAGQGKWYDPQSAAGRRVYWKQISRQLAAFGIDGWWLDASEPELSGAWGEYRDFKTAAGPGAKVFNAYPLMHTKAVYEGQRSENKDKRVFILTRSAYAGQQRNSAVTWSGDISSTWDVFAKQIPAGINFSLSGIPYWNTDTGGFFGNNANNPNFRELFTRWFQYSTFCPMLRIHGTDGPKEFWRFDEATQKVLIQYNHLRYHLIPYIYSTSWQVTSNNDSMMRGLILDFQNDPKVQDIPDQYLFGPSLMVCPVTQPKASKRDVYLPKGTTWYDFWTGQKLAGGQTLSASAPIQTMPIYVKAGAIIPYGSDVQYASQKTTTTELRVYKGADGHFTLYEDQGDGYAYEHGAYATTDITWNEATQTLTLGKRKGSFPGMAKKHTFKVVFVKPGHGTGIPNSTKADTTIQYDGHPVKIQAK